MLNPFFQLAFWRWMVGRTVAKHHGKLDSIGSGDKWTVPIGGGLSKSMQLDDQPIKIAVDAYYNAIRPKPNSDPRVLQVTLTFFLVPVINLSRAEAYSECLP